MANWRKIIVSGSNVSQLNNDSNYITSDGYGAFATASFNGVNILADGTKAVLNFASGSGQGLTIAANATTDTLTFGLNAIPNSSLANNTISGVALGGTLNSLTSGLGLGNIGGATYNGAAARTFFIDSGSAHFISGARKTISVVDTSGPSGIDFTYTPSTGVITGALINSAVTVNAGAGLINGGSVSLGGSTTLNIGAGTHIIVNADDVAVNATTLTAAITGSIYSGVSGDVLINTAGVATIQPNSVALGTDTTGNYVANLIQGSGITVSGAITETATPTVALRNAGSLSNNLVTKWDSSNGQLVNSTITDAASMVTVGNNLTVTGNLFVQGSTTSINTQDLFIADRFILLASGSANAGDGGIVIDRGADAAGNVGYGYDSATNRWGYQNSLNDLSNAITLGTLTSGVASNAFASYVFTEASHGATKPTSGEFLQLGSTYIASNEDIWIYS